MNPETIENDPLYLELPCLFCAKHGLAVGALPEPVKSTGKLFPSSGQLSLQIQA